VAASAEVNSEFDVFLLYAGFALRSARRITGTPIVCKGPKYFYSYWALNFNHFNHRP